MPDSTSPLACRLLRRADHALPVLALLAVWVLVLYRKALISLTHHHVSQAKGRVKLAVRRFRTAGRQFLKAQALVQ